MVLAAIGAEARPALAAALTRAGRAGILSFAASPRGRSSRSGSRSGWSHTLLVAPWPPEIFNDEAYYSDAGAADRPRRGLHPPGRVLRATACSLPTAERAPLFPLALAGLAELGVRDGDARLLGRARPAAARSWSLGLLGRRLAGERAGLIAAGLAALYPTLIAADGALMTESLYGAAGRRRAAGRLPAGRRARAPAARSSSARSPAWRRSSRAEALLLLPLVLLPLLRRPGGLRAAAVVVRGLRRGAHALDGRATGAVFDRPVLDRHRGRRDAGRAPTATPIYYGDRIGSWSVAVRRVLRPRQRGRGAQRAGPRRGSTTRSTTRAASRVVAAARLARTWGALRAVRRARGPRAVGHARSASASTCCCCRSPRTAWSWCTAAGWAPGSSPRRSSRSRSRRCWPTATVRFRHSAELAIVVLAAVAARPSVARERPRPSRPLTPRGAAPPSRRGRSRPPRPAAAPGCAATRAAAAALVYALLRSCSTGAALLPGHTLSASDFLWSAAPWAAERPADVRVPGLELRARRRLDAVRSRGWSTRASGCPTRRCGTPTSAVGRPALRQRAVGGAVAVQPARLRAAVLVVAGRHRRC